MAIGNHNDLTHIVRTSDQWKNTYDKYELIPTGVLCVELVSSDVTKIKIGDGHNIFSKLPYIGDLDLSKYYTKLETDTRIKEILTQEKVVRIKGILGNKSDLPAEARCGDIYFVRQLSSSDNKYIEYIYSPDNTWEPLGGIPVDIDLSEYAKTAYVDDKIEQVNERIDDIEQHGTHTHSNKEILDQITEPYTTADKETLASLHNYDDTEIREMISQSSHTHANKDILDAISAAFTREDKSKLDQLNPYDDSTIKERISELERVAHEHSNKRILDQTTASFTKEYERKMRWIRMYTGCTGMEEGIAGLVPAAQAGEEDYVLSGSGEWVPQTGGGGTYELPIATTSTLGGIKVGDGLEIDANGKLSVVGGGGGGDSIAEGDGITITTDPQTGVKTISVNTGDHLSVDSQTGELNVTGVDYEAGQGIRIGSNYNFLEYIKNSGNYDQIILTDILPKYDDKLVIDMQFGIGTGLTNNTGFYGVRENNTSVYCTSMWVDSRDTWNTISTYNHFDYEQGQQSHVFSVSSTAKHHGNNPRQLFTVHQNIATWGNDTINFADQYDSSLSDPTLPFAIFGRNMNGVLNPFYTFELFVYNVKLYDSNNVLIHDLRPVERVSDNAAGLYDVLTNKFYGNAGGGSFVKGPVVTTPDRIINAKIGNGLQFDSNNAIEIDPSIIPEVPQYYPGEAIDITASSDSNLPAGYAEVDYIEAPGNAYTIIDYIPNRNTKIVGTAMMIDTSTDPVVFGARTGNSGQQFVFWFNRYSSTQAKVGFVYGANTWSTSTDCDEGKLIPYVVGDQFTFLLSLEDEFNVNGEFVHNITENGTPASDIKLGIFALTRTNTSIESNNTIFKGRMYEFKIYENDELVVNLVPAIYISTGSVGFYDTIGDTFYTSRTSTSFICDPSTVHGSGYLVNVKYNHGLTVNQDNELEVNTGDGLQINQDGELEIDPSIIPEVTEYEAGEAIEIAEVTHEDEFRVQNQEYFFDTRGLTCGLGARTWTTVNDGDILAAMCIHNNGGNQVPLFVGLTEDSVKVSQNYNSTILGPNGSFDYRGKTWYFTADYALSGTDGQDTQGHIQTLPTTYSFNSTPSNFVPAAKDLIDLAVLLSDLEYPVISVKYNKGLTVNQDNELEVNLGSGLSFNQDGEIEADQYTLPTASASTLGGVKVGTGLSIAADGTLSTTGGGGSGGGPEYAEGDAIEIDTQTLSFNVDAIRWDISDIKSIYQQGGPYTQMRSIEFCDSSNVAHALDSGSAIWDDGDTVSYATVSETIDELVANTGKMCAVWRYPNRVLKLTFNLDTPTPLSDIVKFRMKTANDTSERDPKAWKIYVRNATTQQWYLVHETSDAKITGTRDTWSDYYTFTSATETSINVKYGNGLTLNQNNELEVNIGDRLHFDSNNALAVNPYYEGEGISIHTMGVPTGYTRVKALSSTDGGNQYIDTGYKINPNTVIELSAVFYKYGSNQWKIPLGTRNRSDYASNGILFLVTWQTDQPGNNPSLWIERTQSVAPSDKKDEFYNDIVNIRIAGTSLTCTNTRTGVTTVLDTATAMPISQYNLFVFATNDHGNMSFHTQMDLYSLTISEADTVIHQYIPCKRDSDNKYGLYDTIDQEFKLSPNNALFTYVTGAPSGDDPLIEEISLLPATEDTLGGIKIGDGLVIDEDGVVSTTSVEYEGGTAILVVDNSNPYINKVRWTISDIRGTSDSWIQMRYFGFYNENQERLTIQSGLGEWSDDSIVTYYQHRTLSAMINNQYEMTASLWDGTKSFILTFNLPVGTRLNDLKYFRYQTGDDETHRDPVSWEIHAYSEELDAWLLLNTETNATIPTGRDTWTDYFDLEYVPTKTIDAWNSGTGWDNFAYTSGDSDSTSGWNRCVHSPVSSINTLFPVLSTKIKVIARDQNDGLLSVRIELHTSAGRHYGCYEYSQDEEIIDLKEFCELHSVDVPAYVSLGLCTLVNPNYANISPSNVSRVDIIWYTDIVSPTKDINVKYGDGLTVNQNNELEVKLGDGLTIDEDGAIEADQYTLPAASASTLGGIKVGDGLSVESDGTLSVVGGSGGGNSGNYIEGEAIEFEEGASRLPTGYTELENISNVSASYIDTGYIPNTDTQLSIIANIHRGTTSWQTLFGARDAVNPGGTEYAFFVRLNDNYNFYPRITGDQYTYMPNQTYDEKIRIDINNTTATVTRQDGSSYSYTQTGSLSNLSTTLAIFALHNQTGYVDNGIIDLYSFKIYENNTIVKDFVPCKRNSDDAIGLIDIINNVFYTNLGTGTFTAGRILTNTSINVKYGTGLSVDPVTNELFVDGQLPEGTIIKKLTYTGNGASTNNIQFDKKPLAILSLNGSSGQNYGSLIPTFIDSPYLHGVFGGSTNSGTTFRSSMSYDDSTNTLSLTNTSDKGLAFNIANKPYVMYYLTKGHTGSGTSVNNEVSVIKSFTYVGTGTSTNNIQFPETPDMLVTISAPGSDNTRLSAAPSAMDADKLVIDVSDANNNNGVIGCSMSFNSMTNVLTLSTTKHVSWCLNMSGTTYTVFYAVNEVIPSTMPYDAGEAISIETIGGLQPTNYSNNDFVDSIASMNAGSIVKAADKSSFTITASMNDCYTRGSSGQANGSYPFNVKASTKYRFAWDSADPTVHGKVYTYENGLYDAMMHEIDQYDSSYLEFTTSPNTTFIQARFGVMYAGDSITYSNVRLYEVIEDEDQYNEISVKHGDGLIVNERNELEVNIGTGLAFDPQTGAINVTGGGGGSGDTVAEGPGIEITTDQQTGNKVIAVNAGTGLQVDQTTNELEIDDSVVTEDDELNLVFVPDDYQPS